MEAPTDSFHQHLFKSRVHRFPSAISKCTRDYLVMRLGNAKATGQARGDPYLDRILPDVSPYLLMQAGASRFSLSMNGTMSLLVWYSAEGFAVAFALNLPVAVFGGHLRCAHRVSVSLGLKMKITSQYYRTANHCSRLPLCERTSQNSYNRTVLNPYSRLLCDR